MHICKTFVACVCSMYKNDDRYLKSRYSKLRLAYLLNANNLRLANEKKIICQK